MHVSCTVLFIEKSTLDFMIPLHPKTKTVCYKSISHPVEQSTEDRKSVV